MAKRRKKSKVGIRRARLADHLELCGLWKQVDGLHAEIRPDFFSRAGEPARSKLYLDRIVEDADQELYVAEVGEDIVGLIHLQIYDTPRSSVFVDRRRAHVEDLVVDETQRRQGIGAALLEAGEKWARKRDASQIVLTVWTGNHGGDAFYERHDYQPVSRVLTREL